MITAKQVRELVEAKPFKAFRICMSDGTHHDITNHDMAFVTKNTVEVGIVAVHRVDRMFREELSPVTE